MPLNSDFLSDKISSIFSRLKKAPVEKPDLAVAPGQVLVDNPSAGVAQAQFTTLRQYRKYIEPVIRDPLIRGYFEIIATIALVIFFLVFAIRPTFNTIAELYKKTDELKQVDTDLGKKIKSLILAQSVYAKLEDRLPLLDRGLPIKPQVDSLITDLESVVAKNQVEMSSFTITKTGLTPDAWSLTKDFKKGEKVPIPLILSVKGTFVTGNGMLSNIYDLERLIDLSSVNFSSSKEGDSSLLITISGKAYFLP